MREQNGSRTKIVINSLAAITGAGNCEMFWKVNKKLMNNLCMKGCTLNKSAVKRMTGV